MPSWAVGTKARAGCWLDTLPFLSSMFSVSRQTDYAVRIVLHLACQAVGARVSIASMAQERHLPVPFVRRIVSRLAEVGILETFRGVGGGVALARSPEQVTLQDVIEAMEGPSCPSPCLEEPRFCPLAATCPVRGVWTQAAKVLDTHLRSVRISDLAGGTGHVAAHRRGHAKGPARSSKHQQS